MKNRNLYEDLKVTAPEPKQLQTPRFPVYYYNEEGELDRTDWVVAMPFKGRDGEASLSDLILAQEELLKYAVFKTAAVGSLVCDPVGLNLLHTIAKMLKVVGKKERGIDLVRLLNSGDYLQIGRIFLSEGYTDDEIVPTDYVASAIARIHRMDFGGKLAELAQARRKADLNKQVEAIEEMAESSRPGSPDMGTTQAVEPKVEVTIPEPIKITTPTNTPPPVPVASIST